MPIKISFLLLLASLGPMSPAPVGATIVKITDSVVDPAALYFVKPSWGHTVNGQSFQQDAITT